VGHLVRCVALAEEMAARGWEPVFLADLGGVDFAERQLAARGLPWEPAPGDAAEHVAAARRLDLDAVVLDSYTLPTAVSEAVVAAGVPVLAVVDGPLRGQQAHLYVDQNIGAESDDVALPAGTHRLAGTRYAMLRDAVRSRRPTHPWRPAASGARAAQVVVAFGGTDAFGLTETTVRALLATPHPFRATVVAPDPGLRERLGALDRARVDAVPPLHDFPALLAGADLVIGAAGTSAWEYCCLGVPAAVAAVVDNQLTAYGRLVELGAVIGLGTLDDVRSDAEAFAGRVAGALADTGARTRAAALAHRLVDGAGRVRVADALAALVADPTRVRAVPGLPG
jgi:spore coat polysaccharide biosynthesis predicted glycosyltransferase SpsG